MSKHTPGPWYTKGYRHAIADTVAVCYGDQSHYIAKCHPFNGEPNDPETARANAHLISAAPDMLAALEYLIMAAGYATGKHEPTLKELSAPLDAWDIALAAIAKAKGE